MPPRFFLRLLGDPELHSPDGEVVRFRVRKHLALLSYLASHRGHVYRRDRLAEFLWPDASPAEGRHSVAVALSAIRGKLGLRTFECTRDTARFVAPNLEVDLDRLARGEILSGEFTTALEVDAFLGGFEVTRAPEFMLWRDQMRARWLPQIQNALVALMDRCRRTGDFSRIERHAERLFALDEYSEQAVRARMEARAFAGDRVGAIRIYQEWRDRLSRDLDATPSPLLEQMAHRLRRRGIEPVGADHLPAVMTELWRDRAFIGRAVQYRALYENWERTRDGRPRHGLVLGESGVGKSTLAERLATATALEGAVSSRVQCYEVEREIPYAAVGTLVRGLLEQPGAGGTPPEWLGELARTVSAVRDRFPHLPAPPAADGETIRIRLAEAVQQLAAAVAEEHPVILVVDDVHLADDASVAVLHVLMRRTESQRVMVLMTARREELDRSPHAGRLVESRRHLGLEVLEVPPFTEEEMHELVTALGAAVRVSVPPSLRRALVAAAAGIPMVAELLFDDWRRRGPECLALSLEAMTSDLPGWRTEEVYRQLFQRVFDSLSGEARAVLNLAAILGERLNDSTMYELVDLTRGQCYAGLLELTRQRVLVDTGQVLQFRNELVRGYAYLAVPSPLRRALHGLVAERLMREAETGSSVPGLSIAWHCFRGGKAAEAVPYLLGGSREAIDHGAPHAAELALGSAAAALPPEHLAPAMLLRAEALQEEGRWEESIEVLEEREHADDDWRQRRNVLSLRARASLPHSELQARETLAQLQRLAAEGIPSAMDSVVLEAMERVVGYLGETNCAGVLITWAAQVLETSQTTPDRVRAAISFAVLTWMTRRSEDYLEVLETLRSLSAEAESKGFACAALGRLHTVQGSMCTAVADYNAAIPHYQSALAIAKRLGDSSTQASAEHNLALCYGRLGDYKAQLYWAEKGIQNLPHSADSWTRAKLFYRAASALAMTGEAQRALAMVHRVDEFRHDESRSWARQAEGVTRADVLQLVGEDRRALSIVSETFEETGLHPLSHGYAGPVARWLAVWGLQKGNRNEATRVLGELFDELRSHDLIDQAEIVLARSWLQRKSGTPWQVEPAVLEELLSRIPFATRHHLARLGFTV